jgi:lipooligosaccharide transport system permease protein
VSSVITPLLYVVAMGVLLGGFIKGDPSRLDGADSYLAFVAPGLLAAHTMQTAFGEATFPVLGMVKWDKVYYSQTATSLRVRDVIAAHIAVIALRLLIVSAIFGAIIGCFGVFHSVIGSILAVLLQPLIGLAFATPLYALATGLEEPGAFSPIMRLGITPMFLFSGAFFPLSNLPSGLEWIAKFTPLWQGVDLTRMLVLGDVDASRAVIHLVYLGALVVAGYVWAHRRLSRRLEQ